MSTKHKRKIRQNYNEFYYILSLFFIGLIIASNIFLYSRPTKPKVLGVNISNEEGVYWYQLLQKNPNYIPGWLEIGRLDKVKSIDPNYF